MLSTLKFSLLAGVLAQTAVAKTNAVNMDVVANTIHKYVDSYSTSSSAATLSCTVSGSNACPLTDMPKDQTTLVLPGGETRCIYSYSSPFKFQVKRIRK